MPTPLAGTTAKSPEAASDALSSSDAPDATLGWVMEPDWIGRIAPPPGHAEIAHYDAVRVVGLEERSFGQTLRLSATTLDRTTYTPLRPPFGATPTVEVLAMDATATIPDVEGGERQERAQFYVERHDRTRLVRRIGFVSEPRGLVYTSQEYWRAPAVMKIRSTLPGVRDGETVLAWSLDTTAPPPLPEDALPLLLRGLLFEPGRRYRFQVLPTGDIPFRLATTPLEAELLCVAIEMEFGVPVETASDAATKNAVSHQEGQPPSDQSSLRNRSVSGEPVRVFHYQREDGVRGAYRVLEAPPRPLVRWETNDGRSLRLRSLKTAR